MAAIAAATALVCASTAAAFGYEVKSGDTFAGLAKRFYGTSVGWEKIARANAGRLVPGKTILIPEEGDPDNPAARIAAVEGDVALRAPADEGWRPATAGAPLLWQRSLRTGTEGRARLELRDGAWVRVDPGTELTVLGDTGGRLRITLESGGVELDAQTPSALEIVVGESIWCLEGRSAALRRTVTHLVTGAADGKVYSVETSLETGTAARVRLDGTVESRATLPQAPRFEHPADHVALGFGGAVRISWSAAESADVYDVEIDERRQQVREPHAELPVELTGLVRARVRARGEFGIAGRWADHAVFAVVADASRSPVPTKGPEMARFVGAVTLQFRDLPRGSSLYARLDGGLPRKVRDSLRLELGGVGDHELQLLGDVMVAERRVAVNALVPLVVAPIPGVTVTFEPGVLDPLAPPPEVQVTVSLRDMDQRPVVGEVPVVTAGARSCVAQPTGSPGEYTCVLRPRAAPGIERLELVVRGQGDSFVATRHFEVRVPSEAAIHVR